MTTTYPTIEEALKAAGRPTDESRSDYIHPQWLRTVGLLREPTPGRFVATPIVRNGWA